MREYKITTGGRRWHGDELTKLQSETLDVLQDFFKQAGACVIDGCTVTGVPGNYNIAPGLVGISHADGFKIARFPGVSGVAFPLYLKIDKTIQNKIYDDANSKVAYHEYKAGYSSSIPLEPYLKFETVGAQAGAKSWQRAFLTDWVTVTNSGINPGNISFNLKYRKNILTNQVYIRGSVTSSSAQTLTAPPTGVTLFNLPVGYRPAETIWYDAHIPIGVGLTIPWFRDAAGFSYLMHVNGLISNTGGVAINIIKPEASVSSYSVIVDLIIALD